MQPRLKSRPSDSAARRQCSPRQVQARLSEVVSGKGGASACLSARSSHLRSVSPPRRTAALPVAPAVSRLSRADFTPSHNRQKARLDK